MDVNKLIDSTKLNACATIEDIKKLLDEAINYHFQAVCVNPCYVKQAHEYLKNTNVLVATVVGFPLGANTITTKEYEAIEAINNGADEIDMVINIGALKNHDYEYIKKEIEKEISSESMRLSWGRFYLYGDTIKGQEFYTYGGGLGHLFPIEYHLIENKFLILNKSQIILLKSKNSRNISFNHHDTLNFEPYSNRRDSTFFFKNKRWFNKFNLFYTKKMKEIKPF